MDLGVHAVDLGVASVALAIVLMRVLPLRSGDEWTTLRREQVVQEVTTALAS